MKLDVLRHDYKVGDVFHAKTEFSYDPVKVHVMYVLDGVYAGLYDSTKTEKLIVYKIFGKHKRWWHQFMCRDFEMDTYRHIYETQFKKIKS